MDVYSGLKQVFNYISSNCLDYIDNFSLNQIMFVIFVSNKFLDKSEKYDNLIEIFIRGSNVINKIQQLKDTNNYLKDSDAKLCLMIKSYHEKYIMSCEEIKKHVYIPDLSKIIIDYI